MDCALFKLIKSQGFKGSYSTVSKFLRAFKKDDPKVSSEKVAHQAREHKELITQYELAESLWTFPGELEEKQKIILNRMLGKPAMQNIYQLIQQFRIMVHHRQSEKLEEWLTKAFDSKIPELQSFVAGIRLDFQAVHNSLIYEFSNGLLEGHVNRLKTIKRMMYGRAKFDLLRQRVLYRIP